MKVLIVSLLLLASCQSGHSKSTSVSDWCQTNLGCECLSTKSDVIKCRTINQKYVEVLPPEREGDYLWHISCKKKPIRDLIYTNISLGKVQFLQLESCDIENVDFADVFKAINITGLQVLKLDLGNDKKQHLKKETFRGLQEMYPEFKMLHLHRVSILDSDILEPLPNLTKLTFKNCKNLTLPESLISPLRNLLHFELFDNAKINQLPENLFDHNPNLMVLNLSTNSLELIQPRLLSRIKSLEEIVLNHNYIRNVSSDLFSNNPNLKSVSWKQDYCSKTSDCKRIFPAGLFEKNQKLEKFNYSWEERSSTDRINGVSFETRFPPSLKVLSVTNVKNLTWANIQNVISGLDRLEELSLDHNQLVLKDNCLKTLPKSLKRFSVVGNLVSCDQCKLIGFNGLAIEKCVAGNSSIDMRDYVRQTHCPDHIKIFIVVGIVAGLFTIFSISILFVILSERIRVRLYHHKFFANFFMEEGRDQENQTFDVFISYAQSDYDLASKMINHLEGNETEGEKNSGRIFKCCIHERDWTIGREISQNIMESVTHSKRTVIILSPDYLHSSYCQQEFNMAYAENKLLVVMRIDPSTKDASVTKDALNCNQFDAIRKYVQTFTYLREDDPKFWPKLVYRLPHKKMTQHNSSKKGLKLQRRISEMKRLLSRTSGDPEDLNGEQPLDDLTNQ